MEDFEAYETGVRCLPLEPRCNFLPGLRLHRTEDAVRPTTLGDLITVIAASTNRCVLRVHLEYDGSKGT